MAYESSVTGKSVIAQKNVYQHLYSLGNPLMRPNLAFNNVINRGVKAKKILTRFNTKGTVKLRVKNVCVKTICVKKKCVKTQCF